MFASGVECFNMTITFATELLTKTTEQTNQLTHFFINQTKQTKQL